VDQVVTKVWIDLWRERERMEHFCRVVEGYVALLWLMALRSRGLGKGGELLEFVILNAGCWWMQQGREHGEEAGGRVCER
jgi:hypothetical protein